MFRTVPLSINRSFSRHTQQWYMSYRFGEPNQFRPDPARKLSANLNDIYRGADKSLARLGRKQSRKHVRDAHDFNNIETRAVIKFFPLQGKALKEIHGILREILFCVLPDRAKDLSAPLYHCCVYSEKLLMMDRRTVRNM